MKICYDFHIHSCLSPCGDSEMTPNNIVNMAMLSGLNAIALTDHNTCGNCAATAEVAKGAGLIFLAGMELCTAEEIHVVCLFPTVDAAERFEREVVAPARPPIQNRAEIFGEQVICDAEDEVVGYEPILLTTATAIGIDEVAARVRAYGGTAFPAHIDRPSYSVIASLGTLPPLPFAAVEISDSGDVQALKAAHGEIGDKPLLRNSDAHYLENIHEAEAYLDLPDGSAQTIIDAIDGKFSFEWQR